MAEYYEIMTDDEMRRKALKEAGIDRVSQSKRSRKQKIKDAATRAGAKAKIYAGKAYERGKAAGKAGAKRAQKEIKKAAKKKLAEFKKPRKQQPRRQEPDLLGFGGGGSSWFDEPRKPSKNLAVDNSFNFYWGSSGKKKKKDTWF